MTLWQRKWWIRLIRERNYFGYRYWWFNWSLFVFGCVLFSWLIYTYLDHYSANPCTIGDLSATINSVEQALTTCCPCQTIIAPPPPSPPSPPSPTPPPAPPPPPPPPSLPPSPPPDTRPCNSLIHAGAHGVDSKTVWLGTQSGRVVIKYNMETAPDKLEVFYEGKRITSTFEVPGNIDGFVGGGNSAGAKGELVFNYNYHVDGFITIVVHGRDLGTEWDYNVSCPQIHM